LPCLSTKTTSDSKKDPSTSTTPDIIFSNGAIVSLSDQARNYLQGSDLEWDAVFLRLRDQFPALLPDPTELCPVGDSVLLPSEIEGDRLYLICENRAGQVHIRLTLGPAEPARPGISPPAIDAIASLAPYPIWQINAKGDVVWSNFAHRHLRDQLDAPPDQNTPIFETNDQQEPLRSGLTGSDGETLWYNVVSKS